MNRGQNVEEHSSGLRILRGISDADPAVALASVFPEPPEVQTLQTFDFESPTGPMDPHYHTEDMAALVVKGRLLLDIGPDREERLEFAPGDCVYVPAGPAHGEEIGGEDGILARIGSLAPFHIVTVD